MWISMQMRAKAVVSVEGMNVSIPFSGMADGCVGCMLVFETKKEAKAFGGKSCQVIELEEVEK